MMLPSFHKQMEQAGNHSQADRTDLLWVRANLLRRDIYGIIRSPPTICAGHWNFSPLHLWLHVMNGQEQEPGVSPRRSFAPLVFHPLLPMVEGTCPALASWLPGTCEDTEMDKVTSTSRFQRGFPFWELQSFCRATASAQTGASLHTLSVGKPQA